MSIEAVAVAVAAVAFMAEEQVVVGSTWKTSFPRFSEVT